MVISLVFELSRPFLSEFLIGVCMLPLVRSWKLSCIPIPILCLPLPDAAGYSSDPVWKILDGGWPPLTLPFSSTNWFLLYTSRSPNRLLKVMFGFFYEEFGSIWPSWMATGIEWKSFASGVSRDIFCGELGSWWLICCVRRGSLVLSRVVPIWSERIDAGFSCCKSLAFRESYMLKLFCTTVGAWPKAECCFRYYSNGFAPLWIEFSLFRLEFKAEDGSKLDGFEAVMFLGSLETFECTSVDFC